LENKNIMGNKKMKKSERKLFTIEAPPPEHHGTQLGSKNLPQ
jgi:hypothetical protein